MEKVHSYVNINDNLRYFLTPTEFSFLVKLKSLAYLRSKGFRTAYSKDYNFMNFQINKALFYSAATRLERLGLLERVKEGRFTDYIIVEKNYNRLLEIATSTNNIYLLLSFSKNEFIKKRRSIPEILDVEILELREKGNNLDSS